MIGPVPYEIMGGGEMRFQEDPVGPEGQDGDQGEQEQTRHGTVQYLQHMADIAVAQSPHKRHKR